MKIKLFGLIYLSIATIACSTSEQPIKLTKQDTSKVLSLTFNYGHFNKDFQEIYPNNLDIYIYAKAGKSLAKWPKKVDRFNIYPTDKGFFPTGPRDYSKQKIYIIEEPKLVVRGDTLFVSLYSQNVRADYRYKLVQLNGIWKIVHEHSLIK